MVGQFTKPKTFCRVSISEGNRQVYKIRVANLIIINVK